MNAPALPPDRITPGAARRGVDWVCGSRRLRLGERTLIMGVVNVTPDSFSDGGLHASPEAALRRAREVVGEGADLVDIGGESSRPGAGPVPEAEELQRVVPLIRALRPDCPVPISVDTCKPAVARAALEAGADIVNDITALRDPAMAAAVRDHGAGAVLMHMLGEPRTMQQAPAYDDAVAEVARFLRERHDAAVAAGIPSDRIVLDPGIGFGKRPEDNLALMARLPGCGLPRPLLYGVSRKSVVGWLTGRPVGGRKAGSLALLCWLALRGAAVLRVHDVADSCDAARVVDSMLRETAAHDVV